MAPALVCAVVKADAYGHGAVAVAGAAIKGGAHWLAVAMVEEGLELRKSGISSPILLLSEPDPDAMDEAVAYDLIPTLYTHEGLNSIRRAARARSLPNAPTVVQLK
ncbi:MAG: alanine racemase, partial [Actinobacteria bacterium]|nr:alanine racemase [Actinomycetota bacterium]